MAALSIHKSILGNKQLTPASLLLSVNFWRKQLLATTPPPTKSSPTPLRLQASKDFLIKALIALSYNPESLNKYEVQTATTANVDQFLLDARDGRIKIVLPPIQKENIDGQMRDYIASEEAAMKSL